jgi:hypothetical protein
MNQVELDLVHFSLDTFKDDDENLEDIDNILRLHPHGVALSETGQAKMVRLIQNHIKNSRYELINPDKGDISFLLRDDCKLLDDGGELVVPAARKRPGMVGHTSRHNSFINFEFKDEEFYWTAIHALALHGDNKRKQDQLDQFDSYAKQIWRFSRGRALSFGSGDFNTVLPNNHAFQNILETYGITTSAHETGVDDPTHGNRRIDYFMTVDRDGRVVVVFMDVLRGHRFNSDHDPIYVRIKVKQLVSK